VTEGKRADLILVDGNPLDDVTVLSRRQGVMIKGQWFSQSKLQKRISEAVSSN